MIDFLFFCLSCSLAIIGLHVAACWPGMVFYEMRNRVADIVRAVRAVRANNYSPLHTLSQWIKKPLYQCPICMASLWTTLFWAMFIRGDYLYLLLAIPLVAGINIFLCIVLQNFTDYGCNG
jgi:hypothetical protein